MRYTPSTQPETGKQLLLRSLRLYRFVLSHVFVLAFLLSVTSFIPRLLALAVGQDVFAALPHFSPHRLWLVVIEITCLFFFTAMLWRIQSAINGAHETIKDDMKIAIKKLPFIFVTAAIQTTIFILIAITTMSFYSFLQQQNLLLGTNTASIFFIMVPWFLQVMLNVYIAVLFLFYLPLILTENKSIFGSLTESAHLVWGKWWRTFGVQITPWCCYLVILLLAKHVAQINIHIYFSPLTEQSLFATCFNILLFALFVPWIASLLLVQLRDLELRKNT